MSEHTYRLKYVLEAGEFTKADLDKMGDNVGACDAAIVISILRGPRGAEGDRSFMVLSADGHEDGAPLHPKEIFHAWAMLAKGLSEAGAFLSPWQVELADRTFQEIRKHVLAERTPPAEG
jgi:hypothetical protein